MSDLADYEQSFVAALDPTKPNLPEGQIRVYDNTRLESFEGCHRKYFYEHELGWHREGIRAPLIFGSSWHSAMDVVWDLLADWEGQDSKGIRGFDTELAREVHEKAALAFAKKWVEEGGPDLSDYESIEALAPRTPSTADSMLWEYIDARWQFLREIKLVSIEQPFLVPLDPDDPTLWYAGRMDKVFTRGSHLIVVDHKTTKAYAKDGFFRNYFADSFSPNAQFDGYAYAGHLSFRGRYHGDIWADGALVHKSVHEGFRFIPIKRPMAQLEGWRWETLDRVRDLEANRAAYIGQRTNGGCNDPYMAAFRKDTKACWDWMQECPCADLCKTWENPIDKPLPMDMVERKWSPFDEVDLEKLGVTREKAGEDV